MFVTRHHAKHLKGADWCSGKGIGFRTKGSLVRALEDVLSTQSDSEGQQSPYLASFCHSLSLHPMISLACQIFSVQPHSACVLLKSSLCCALHVQTISFYRCRAPHLSPGCLVLVKPRKRWTDDRHGQTMTRLETMLCLMC